MALLADRSELIKKKQVATVLYVSNKEKDPSYKPVQTMADPSRSGHFLRTFLQTIIKNENKINFSGDIGTSYNPLLIFAED